MRSVLNKIVWTTVLLSVFGGTAAATRNSLEYEGAWVFTGYNNVAIPGNTGDRFSLKHDLTPETTLAYRLCYGRALSDKHWAGVLVAPLTVQSSGTLNREVNFKGVTFASGNKVDAKFQFSSYRLLYRYTFKQTDTFKFSLGGALKVRDADITLSSANANASKTNLGFVPLLSFNATWKLTDNLDVLMDGEALAAPQGRAEDVLFAAQYKVNDNLAFNGGYRVLEGGADNDEVYTFSAFNYAVLGAVWRF